MPLDYGAHADRQHTMEQCRIMAKRAKNEFYPTRSARRKRMAYPILDFDDESEAIIHPAKKKHVKLATIVAMYAWHGDHHLGHLRIVAEKRIGQAGT